MIETKPSLNFPLFKIIFKNWNSMSITTKEMQSSWDSSPLEFVTDEILSQMKYSINIISVKIDKWNPYNYFLEWWILLQTIT